MNRKRTAAAIVQRGLTFVIISLVCMSLMIATTQGVGGAVQREVRVNFDQPPIFHSDKPAELIVFVGKPRFKPIDKTKLLFAINTNWDVILDSVTSTYYVLNNAIAGTDSLAEPLADSATTAMFADAGALDASTSSFECSDTTS